jgi:cyclopropane fatty-acyl-phospholipid synthase-like methyltransferase
MYSESDDPWGFETRPYEAEKYRATLAVLPHKTYRSAFEIGCSIGVLTEGLAGRCESLLAVDVSERALQRAQERCRHLPHVQFELMQVPDEFPDTSFDLILVSEVAYYWSRDDLLRTRRRIVEHLDRGGQVLLVHWTPFVDDYPLTGDVVHETFREAGDELRHLGGQRADLYRLDLFEKPG